MEETHAFQIVSNWRAQLGADDSETAGPRGGGAGCLQRVEACFSEDVRMQPAPTTMLVRPYWGRLRYDHRWSPRGQRPVLRPGGAVASLAVVWLVVLFAGCRPHGGPAAGGPNGALPKVTVEYPVRRPVQTFREFTGRLEAVETVEVRARVRGFLSKVYLQPAGVDQTTSNVSGRATGSAQASGPTPTASTSLAAGPANTPGSSGPIATGTVEEDPPRMIREGDEVRAGDLLYLIDPRPYEADVERAAAEVRRLESQLKLAEGELARSQRLVRSRTITEEEYLQRLSTRDTARAQLQQAQAALRNSQLELEFTRVRAPISGQIGRSQVTVGNLVGYNEPTLLTRIVRLDPIYVYFEGTERGMLEYDRLVRAKGVPRAADARVPVEVGLEVETGYPHKGVIDFRDNRVDPGTGTIQIRGVLPNPDRTLVAGLYARVRVPIGEAEPQTLVPQLAVQSDQRGEFLLVVAPSGEVAARPIKTGRVEGDQIVVLEGLEEGDRVVVNGIQRARPGSRVDAELEPAEGGDLAAREAIGDGAEGARRP